MGGESAPRGGGPRIQLALLRIDIHHGKLAAHGGQAGIGACRASTRCYSEGRAYGDVRGVLRVGNGHVLRPVRELDLSDVAGGRSTSLHGGVETEVFCLQPEMVVAPASTQSVRRLCCYCRVFP